MWISAEGLVSRQLLWKGVISNKKYIVVNGYQYVPKKIFVLTTTILFLQVVLKNVETSNMYYASRLQKGTNVYFISTAKNMKYMYLKIMVVVYHICPLISTILSYAWHSDKEQENKHLHCPFYLFCFVFFFFPSKITFIWPLLPCGTHTCWPKGHHVFF